MTHQAPHHEAQAGMTLQVVVAQAQAGTAALVHLLAQAGTVVQVHQALAIQALAQAGTNYDSYRDSTGSRYIQRDSDGYLRWIQSRQVYK